METAADRLQITAGINSNRRREREWEREEKMGMEMQKGKGREEDRAADEKGSGSRQTCRKRQQMQKDSKANRLNPADRREKLPDKGEDERHATDNAGMAIKGIGTQAPESDLTD